MGSTHIFLAENLLKKVVEKTVRGNELDEGDPSSPLPFYID